jgi:hypothetical protein
MGRGAFYNPWIFAHTAHYLLTGRLAPEPSFTERLRVMNRHLDLMIEVFGEKLGCTMFRKIGPWYAKRFGPASHFNKGIVKITGRADYEALIESYTAWRGQFLDSDGHLLPKYAPLPMGLNFCDQETAEPVVARRTAIPVPAGPNELW